WHDREPPPHAVHRRRLGPTGRTAARVGDRVARCRVRGGVGGRLLGRPGGAATELAARRRMATVDGSGPPCGRSTALERGRVAYVRLGCHRCRLTIVRVAIGHEPDPLPSSHGYPIRTPPTLRGR